MINLFSAASGIIAYGIMKKEGRIGLFIPPTYERNYPPLGTPALSGFLKSKGMDVFQADLNIIYFDYLRKNRLGKLLTPKYKSEKIRKKVYYYKILQSEDNGRKFLYGFENNPGSSFAFTETILSSDILFRYIQDKEENPFVRFFHKEVLPRVKDENISIAGLSITCPSQVIASFTFGYLLKRYLRDVKIVIGGQYVSFFKEELKKKRDFAQFYDYIIFFEGETPLFELADSLTNNRPLSDVPNLIYSDNGKWITGGKIAYEDMDKLPTPDFDGLPTKKYLDSRKKSTLSFETSRGCYWNRCIFCVDLPLPRPQYREKSPDLVIMDIKKLIKKYKTKRLIISNTAYSPSHMRDISKRILEEGIKISWWAQARFDNGFDRDTLRLAKESGCETIGFGLESINQRVLDFIGKGTKVGIIKRIVKDAYELKLGIHFQVIIGLPSESVEEALDTFGFLIRRPEAAKRHAAYNPYFLIPKNRVFFNPEKFGIRIIKKRTHLPFRYFYSFKHITGDIGRDKAYKIMRIYNAINSKMRSKQRK
ncbi:MAG: hypothetical protein A2987_04100 [Omnitrophica bacterium RIFCSPLOWO2_01_FULL_45_10]|nr:MAG: hypothetical protein A2987_04100 [Omnitrophica bacterium RIFCSPLOWO2_01_FULL_45_10]